MTVIQHGFEFAVSNIVLINLINKIEMLPPQHNLSEHSGPSAPGLYIWIFYENDYKSMIRCLFSYSVHNSTPVVCYAVHIHINMHTDSCYILSQFNHN